jgi:hypothetical protein
MSSASTASLAYTPFSKKLTASLDQISGIIEENAKIIDVVQEVALELTNSISALHVVMVKYAGIANGILDALLPILRGLPIIPKNIMEMLVNLERITQRVIDNKEATSKTINEVKTSLQTGDISKLQNHAGELKKLSETVTSILT